MFGQHTRNVIIHHHDFIGQFKKLLRKDTDRRRATANAHTLLFYTINDGCTSGLNDKTCPTFNTQLSSLLITERLHHLHGDAALFFTSARQVVHTTKRKHL